MAYKSNGTSFSLVPYFLFRTKKTTPGNKKRILLLHLQQIINRQYNKKNTPRGNRKAEEAIYRSTEH
jgi:hypothetical protein